MQTLNNKNYIYNYMGKGGKERIVQSNTSQIYTHLQKKHKLVWLWHENMCDDDRLVWEAVLIEFTSNKKTKQYFVTVALS